MWNLHIFYFNVIWAILQSFRPFETRNVLQQIKVYPLIIHLDYNSIRKTEHSYITILVKVSAQNIGLSCYTLLHINTLFSMFNVENIPNLFLSISIRSKNYSILRICFWHLVFCFTLLSFEFMKLWPPLWINYIKNGIIPEFTFMLKMQNMHKTHGKYIDINDS